MTSTNASFFRYFTSFRLQEIAPVAWIVIFEASSLCRPREFQRAIGTTKTERGRKQRRTYNSLLRFYSFCCNVHFEGIGLRILRVTKVENFCGTLPRNYQRSASSWCIQNASPSSSSYIRLNCAKASQSVAHNFREANKTLNEIETYTKLFLTLSSSSFPK